jgi:site-specific recombinase XerD
LRHTFADGLRREGVDVGVIQRALGHANLATTVRYLDHVSPAQVVAALTARAEPEGLAIL